MYMQMRLQPGAWVATLSKWGRKLVPNPEPDIVPNPHGPPPRVQGREGGCRYRSEVKCELVL